MTTDTKTIPAVSAEVSLNVANMPLDPNHCLRLTFRDGRNIVVQVGDLQPHILTQAIMHGLKQKLVDGAAISRNPDTGKPASLDDKYDAVAEIADRLIAGEWNKRREGGETGGLLLRALLRMYDGRKTRDDVVAFLDGKTDAEKVALRNNPKVAAIIAEIKAERVADSSIDSDAILGELDE